LITHFDIQIKIISKHKPSFWTGNYYDQLLEIVDNVLAQSLNDQGHVSCEKGDYDGAVNISDMSEFQEQTERIKLIESINSINQMNKIIEVIKSDTEKKSDAVETKQNDFNSVDEAINEYDVIKLLSKQNEEFKREIKEIKSIVDKIQSDTAEIKSKSELEKANSQINKSDVIKLLVEQKEELQMSIGKLETSLSASIDSLGDQLKGFISTGVGKSQNDWFVELIEEMKEHEESRNRMFQVDMSEFHEQTQRINRLDSKATRIDSDTLKIKEIILGESDFKSNTAEIKLEKVEIKSGKAEIKESIEKQYKPRVSEVDLASNLPPFIAMKEIKSDSTEIKSDSTEIKSDTTYLKSDTTEIKSDTTEIKSDIAEIKSTLDTIKNKKEKEKKVEIKSGIAELKESIEKQHKPRVSEIDLASNLPPCPLASKLYKRADEDRIFAKLAEHKLSCIAGMAGVGKSTLAITYGHHRKQVHKAKVFFFLILNPSQKLY